MTTLDISFEIKKTEEKIANELMRMIVKQLNIKLKPLVPLIQKDLAKQVPMVFSEMDVTKTFDALTIGPLNLEFGFVKGFEEDRVNNILTKIGQSIVVEFQPLRANKAGNTGGFKVKILKSDFSDILGLSAATVLNLSRNPNVPRVLPWLEWLLIEGDAIIISDHVINFVQDHPNSRSGGAIMISDQGGVWQVPSGFSGTRSNNWLTKNIKAHGDFLAGLSLGIIDKHLKTVIG